MDKKIPMSKDIRTRSEVVGASSLLLSAISTVTEPRGQMKSSNGANAAEEELQPASFKPDVAASSLSQKLGGGNFRRVSRSEDSSPYPIPGLAADVLHMRVKEGSKIRNLLRFATARIQGEGEDCTGTSQTQVVFTGSGRGVTKTITCVEILKRRVGGLHQVSKLYQRTVSEMWESPQQGAAAVSVQRTVPAICILLSKDPLDPQEPGYQPPETQSLPSDDGERQRASSAMAQNTAKRVRLEGWSIHST